jgi:predicted nucleic-acid-binding protein
VIAVDTNIVVRLLTQDYEQQYNKSLALFQEQEIFIPDTVLLETEWVLRFAYHFKPD